MSDLPERVLLSRSGQVMRNKILLFLFLLAVSSGSAAHAQTELLKHADFRGETTFDTGVWKRTSNQMAKAVSRVENGNLVLGLAENPIGNAYIKISQPVYLYRRYLYRIRIEFQTATGDKDVRLETGISRTATLYSADLRAVDDGVSMVHVSYFSPLREGGSADFYLTYGNGATGSIIIRKISVTQMKGTPLQTTYHPVQVTGTTTKDPDTSFRAVPWSLGEKNGYAVSAPGPVHRVTNRYIEIFDHDTDNLLPTYDPRAAELIKSVGLASAKDEIKNFQFSVHANRTVKNLTVTSAPITGGGITVTPSVYSFRQRAKQDTDSNTRTYSVKNEIIDPFSMMTKLGIGKNQSFLVSYRVPSNMPAGSYKGNIIVSTAESGARIIPVTFTVRPYVLSRVSSSRNLFIVNSRWMSEWTENQASAKKRITAEISSALDNGFNSLGLIEADLGGKVPFPGIRLDSTGKVEGFTLHASTMFAIQELIRQAQDRNIPLGENLFGMQSLLYKVMKTNNLIPDGIGAYDHTAVWQVLLNETSSTSIADQMGRVFDDIRTQVNAVDPGHVFDYQYYMVDEAGGDELRIGIWLAQVAKANGRAEKTFMTGNLATAAITFNTSFGGSGFVDAYSFFNGGKGYTVPEGADLARGSGAEPWIYDGVYDFQDGNEVRNRYLGGFFNHYLGVDSVMAWKYIEYVGTRAKDPARRLDDFDRINDTWWGGGRDWCLAYLDDTSYRNSYRDYYGVEFDPALKADASGNIDTMQLLGQKEATDDLRYVNMAEAKVALLSGTKKTQLTNRLNAVKAGFPPMRRLLWGANMNKKMLNQARERIAQIIQEALTN